MSADIFSSNGQSHRDTNLFQVHTGASVEKGINKVRTILTGFLPLHAGKIPKSLFALPALQVLFLFDNQLIGSLEDIPAPLSSPLREIVLSSNQLTGPIPKLFFQLTNLQSLDLDSNKLTGTIELGSIWRLRNLTHLSLGNNMISLTEKEDDTIFSRIPKIQHLNLASCNITKFPASLEYIDTIQGLDLSNNQIEGAIPSWVWKNPLVSLNLSHNMFTTIQF
jgi:Leucine-rich repeat (LRR) protein